MAIEIPNFLASYAGGLQLGQQMKQSRSQNALMDARRGYGRNALAAGGEFSPESYLQAYAADAARAGDFEALTSGQKAYGDFQKQQADIGKTQRETRNIDFAGLQKQLELQAQLLGSATDQASWDNSRRLAEANGIDISGVPQQYSPQVVSNLQQMTLTAQQRLDQMWKQRGHDMEVAKFGYQQQNDAQNRAVTLRGQNMTDARVATANELKRQEIAQAPGGARRKMNSTEIKELFETDDIVNASTRAESLLRRALEINNKARSGYFAKTAARVSSEFRQNRDEDNATIDLDNIVSSQALESLKATFGAAPTEGERKILLELQASLEKTPAQRKVILDRAVEAAARRGALAKRKASALRSGEYFGSEYEPAPAAAPRIGTVQDGYIFRGGDPADQNNWSKVR